MIPTDIAQTLPLLATNRPLVTTHPINVLVKHTNPDSLVFVYIL